MENIYQHFRDDEKIFIDQVLDWFQQVEIQYTPYLTPFLDPREQFIVESILGQFEDIELNSYGGYEAAERKRLYLSPSYFKPEQSDFKVGISEIRYPVKFAELSHGKILGTLMGSGINRNTIGDIITDGERWQSFAEDSIMDFLTTSVDKIGKISVQLEEVSYTDIVLPKDSWEDRYEIVSSLRLDVVLASTFNISRQRSKELIASGKVKVNWNDTDRPDIILGIYDVVSIRGYGRIRLQSIEGKTKKEKIRLSMGVLDRNR